MTIDEVIEKEKLIAVVNCNRATAYHTDQNIYSREEEVFRQNAEYHGQIAEWLKELKQLDDGIGRNVIPIPANATNIELIDTIDGMVSTDYKERFIAEYKQLTIRLDKLNTIITKYYNKALEFTPSVPIPILETQAEKMQGYKDILKLRAGLEGINLD